MAVEAKLDNVQPVNRYRLVTNAICLFVAMALVYLMMHIKYPYDQCLANKPNRLLVSLQLGSFSDI